MQITIDLPNLMGERLNSFPSPNEFIIKVLAKALAIKVPKDEIKAVCIEDAFGLYKPKRSVSLENMESAIKEGSIV